MDVLFGSEFTTFTTSFSVINVPMYEINIRHFANSKIVSRKDLCTTHAHKNKNYTNNWDKQTTNKPSGTGNKTPFEPTQR